MCQEHAKSHDQPIHLPPCSLREGTLRTQLQRLHLSAWAQLTKYFSMPKTPVSIMCPFSQHTHLKILWQEHLTCLWAHTCQSMRRYGPRHVACCTARIGSACVNKHNVLIQETSLSLFGLVFSDGPLPKAKPQQSVHSCTTATLQNICSIWTQHRAGCKLTYQLRNSKTWDQNLNGQKITLARPINHWHLQLTADCFLLQRQHVTDKTVNNALTHFQHRLVRRIFTVTEQLQKQETKNEQQNGQEHNRLTHHRVTWHKVLLEASRQL